jgi:hypothetical protein
MVPISGKKGNKLADLLLGPPRFWAALLLLGHLQHFRDFYHTNLLWILERLQLL